MNNLNLSPTRKVRSTSPVKSQVTMTNPISNMTFNPHPTHSSRCTKLKISVNFGSTIFVAGGLLHGRCELICSSAKNLKLGEISVELAGFEGAVLTFEKEFPYRAPQILIFFETLIVIAFLPFVLPSSFTFLEVTERYSCATQSFLSSRIVFQGDRLPPSKAVYGAAEHGFWSAKKGKTTFPFLFKLPYDAPSSYVFQNIASLRYVVTA